jgi:hypothetical protein
MAHAIPVTRSHVSHLAHDPVMQAYWVLRIGFVVAPVIAGLDKFLHLLADWNKYLAPWAADAFGGHTFMYLVGVIEIVAGIGVGVLPRIFAYVVCAWLLAIVVNLLTIPGHYDIALRDFGLALGAFALARLSRTQPGRTPALD